MQKLKIKRKRREGKRKSKNARLNEKRIAKKTAREKM